VGYVAWNLEDMELAKNTWKNDREREQEIQGSGGCLFPGRRVWSSEHENEEVTGRR
jgi:hypothetical protein